jgi:DNA-directed RNA polymerase specialized sigma subunit
MGASTPCAEWWRWSRLGLVKAVDRFDPERGASFISTQREIAGHVGISQIHVSRLLSRSLQQLQQRAVDEEGRSAHVD